MMSFDNEQIIVPRVASSTEIATTRIEANLYCPNHLDIDSDLIT